MYSCSECKVIFIKAYGWKSLPKEAAVDAVMEVLDTIGNVNRVIVYAIYPYSRDFSAALQARDIKLIKLPFQHKQYIAAVSAAIERVCDYVIALNPKEYTPLNRDKTIVITKGGNIDWQNTNTAM